MFIDYSSFDLLLVPFYGFAQSIIDVIISSICVLTPDSIWEREDTLSYCASVPGDTDQGDKTSGFIVPTINDHHSRGSNIHKTLTLGISSSSLLQL